MTQVLLFGILAAFAVFSLLSKRIDRSVVTLPMVFTVLGFLLSEPLAHNTDASTLRDGKRLLAEITLVLVLFADASHVRFHQLAQNWQIPARMLLIGMPLTIAVGTMVAHWLNPGSGMAMALLTAAVLTPTDAALGQSVVVRPDVPQHITQTINVESGLNDGLALPFVLLGAILASTTMGVQVAPGHLALEALREIILGPLAGAAIGFGVARLLDWAQDRDLTNEAATGIVFLCTALMSYVLATIIGGNGFIAAFVAGVAFGNTFRHDIQFISEFMEGAGQLLTMSAFFVFGAFLLPDGLRHAGLVSLTLAILFLTIVRMLPIYVSLIGTPLPARDKLFLGWFGPRGLASILFTLIMMDEFEFPNEPELLACVSLTVAFSIILHGLSANPLASRLVPTSR